MSAELHPGAGARGGGARLTRRRLLVGAGAMAGAGVALPSAAGAKRRRPRRRVVVVGGGLAGLTAAYELHRAGWDVAVLEARRRVGGRVHTLRGFAGGQTAEAGGEYIDTSHTAMRGYARHFGLALDDLRRVGSDNPAATYFAGRLARRSTVQTPAVQREMDRFDRAIAALADRLNPTDPVAAGASLDHRSVASFLDGLRLSPTARMLIEHDTLGDDYTVESDRLSLLAVAAANSVGPDIPESGIEAFRIRGGNDRLPRALARAISGHVHLGAPVDHVSWSREGVRVRAAGETLSASRCVLATPLPPLRRVSFSPRLPGRLAAAIAELQYGVGTKTLLQYANRFWLRAGFSGDTLTDLGISTTWDATNAQRGGRGILLLYTVAGPGRRFQELPDHQRLAEAAAQVQTIYPGASGLLGAATTVAWAKEPYTGGTYTAFAPGQVDRFWRVLRRPVGALHLAGEHTHEYWGYMEGAVRSGRRAAARISAGG